MASDWVPTPRQQAVMRCWAYEVLFGGAAGGGKSDFLTIEAARQVDNPRYTAIMFRRVFPSLNGADGLIQKTMNWYPSLGGVYNRGNHFWQFPSGARIYFGHLQYEHDVRKYQGHAYAFMGFDELTEFMESQYVFMLSRLRAPANAGLRVYTRSTTNPGNLGHEWVKRRFVTRGIVDEVGWFKMVDGKDTRVDPYTDGSLTRAFFPSLLSDNPHLGHQYRSQLENDTDEVRRAQLLDGDWDVSAYLDLVYPDFSYDLNVREVEYDPMSPLYWCADDGYAQGQGIGTESYHPRTILAFQFDPMGAAKVIWEYAKTEETSYEQSIEDFLGMTGTIQPDNVYVDSSAAMFRGALWKAGLPATKSTHRVMEGIKNVRRWIKDKNGVRMLLVHPRCEMTIYEFGKYAKSDKSRDGDLVPMKKDDHAMDALRYGLWHHRLELDP